MIEFSDRISRVEPSATLAITSKAKNMLAQGEDIVILAAGEPDFDTPEAVKVAAKEAVDSGNTKYTPSNGEEFLRKAISHKLLRDNDLRYDIDQIVVSCGAKHSLFNIFQVIGGEANSVAIIPPYWVSYPEIVKLGGWVPKYVDTKGKLKAGVEDIEEALTEEVKALILNSPSNPAGIVYSEEELQEIGKACVDKGIIIISDEIYEKILFDGLEYMSIASISNEIKKNTIVVNGVSKSHSMTGWRIGYAAGSKDIIKKITTFQSQSTSNPCSISQYAAACALSDDLQEVTISFRDEFQRRRDLLIDLLKGSTKIRPYKAQGSFYMFCDISGTGLGSVEFAKRLLVDKKVAVIPGEAFGRDDFVRISFAASEKVLKEGISRILSWTDSL